MARTACRPVTGVVRRLIPFVALEGTVKLAFDLGIVVQHVAFGTALDPNLLGVGQLDFGQLDNTSGRASWILGCMREVLRVSMALRLSRVGGVLQALECSWA